jgi:hypothetical protein
MIPDFGGQDIRLPWMQENGHLGGDGRFHTNHLPILVAGHVGHGFGLLRAGVPDHGGGGALLADQDVLPGFRGLDAAGTIGEQVDAVGLTGKCHHPWLVFTGIAFHLVQVVGIFKAMQAAGAPVGDLEIGVQGATDADRDDIAVLHAQGQTQGGAEGDGQAQPKGMGPEGEGLGAVLQPQGQDDCAVGLVINGQQAPQGGAGKAMGRFGGIVKMVAEPGPAHRNPAPDGLSRLIEAGATDPQERGLTGGLVVGDVSAVEEDPAPAQFRGDLSGNQAGRAGAEGQLPRTAKSGGQGGKGLRGLSVHGQGGYPLRPAMATVAAASWVIAPQLCAAISFSGTIQEPPTQATFFRAR